MLRNGPFRKPNLVVNTHVCVEASEPKGRGAAQGGGLWRPREEGEGRCMTRSRKMRASPGTASHSGLSINNVCACHCHTVAAAAKSVVPRLSDSITPEPHHVMVEQTVYGKWLLLQRMKLMLLTRVIVCAHRHRDPRVGCWAGEGGLRRPAQGRGQSLLTFNLT